MGLSFKEKRALQAQVKVSLSSLSKEGLSFKEKRSIQKQLKEALASLGVTAKKAVSRLEELLAGKYLDLDPVPFMDLIEEIVTKKEADLQQVKGPVLTYYEQNLIA